MKRRQVVVKLTAYQALRTERLAESLWPEERLTISEISRRLLLEHLLFLEDQHRLVERLD